MPRSASQAGVRDGAFHRRMLIGFISFSRLSVRSTRASTSPRAVETAKPARAPRVVESQTTKCSRTRWPGSRA